MRQSRLWSKYFSGICRFQSLSPFVYTAKRKKNPGQKLTFFVSPFWIKRGLSVNWKQPIVISGPGRARPRLVAAGPGTDVAPGPETAAGRAPGRGPAASERATPRARRDKISISKYTTVQLWSKCKTTPLVSTPSVFVFSKPKKKKYVVFGQLTPQFSIRNRASIRVNYVCLEHFPCARKIIAWVSEKNASQTVAEHQLVDAQTFQQNSDGWNIFIRFYLAVKFGTFDHSKAATSFSTVSVCSAEKHMYVHTNVFCQSTYVPRWNKRQ